MIITPINDYDRFELRPSRPKTSHARLQLTDISQDAEVVIPPLPMHFTPSTATLILGTQKRLESLKSAKGSPGKNTSSHDMKMKRIARKTRSHRVKSAVSQGSYDQSDDDTRSQSLTTDREWSWLDEKYDYDKDSDDEFAQKAKEQICEHSVEVYKKVCQKYGEVPSRIVMLSLNAKEHKLAIKNSHLGPKGAKALAVALAVNSSIEAVDLTGNDIGSEGTNYICQTLAENVFISQLTLAENCLQSAGIKCLADNIKKNQHVQVLNISGNSLEEYDAIHIAQIIRENTVIKELYASHNALRERGGQILGNALVENRTIQILDLSWNHLRRKGGVAIAECLKHNTGLKRLNLSWNGLHIEGCRALKRSLPENHSLIELDLSSNRITVECLEELLRGLKKNDMISTIKLKNNQLTTDGLNLLLQSVSSATNWAVREIDISTEIVDMQFVMKYEELRSKHPVFIKYGLVRPCYVKLEQTQDDSAAFLNDDPMVVLMEYMRLQNLRLVDLFTSLDADNSKSLSREEFRCGMLAANIPLGEDMLNRLIKDLDQDNDGEVDFNELLEGLKAHKKKVSKMMHKQKHLKFEETDIGRVSLKIKALLQFRMLFHKMSLAKNKVEKEAMETTLQEFSDKFSDLSTMKNSNMLQAGMERARKAANQRKDSNLRKASAMTQSNSSLNSNTTTSSSSAATQKNSITAKMPSITESGKKSASPFKKLGKSMMRAASAPTKKKR